MLEVKSWIGFDFVAADKALDESFVARLVAVDDRLGGGNDLIEHAAQRPGRVHGHAVNDRHFFLRERENRLLYAVFENFEFVLPNAVDRPVVAIDDAHVQRHQVSVNPERAAFVDFRGRSVRCWRRFRSEDWRRWRRAELRRDPSARARLDGVGAGDVGVGVGDAVVVRGRSCALVMPATITDRVASALNQTTSVPRRERIPSRTLKTHQ